MTFRKIIRTVTPFLFVLLSLEAHSSTRQSQVIDGLKMDELHQSAPDFDFTDAKGNQIQLKAYRGKAVLLHFWASWCTPCQKELPDLVQLSKKLNGKNWVFLPISVDGPDQKAKAVKFLQGLKPEVPYFQVQDSKAADKYKTWGLPVTYLISPSGEIVARALGRRDWGAIKPDTVHDLNELFSGSK
jgi:thiol-disulfide isomerase/thioredoxin